MQKLINPHAHSAVSDGELSIEEIDQVAQKNNTSIIVTDHNTVDAHRNFSSQWIGAGIEVKTESGADILVCGDRERIIELFDAELQKRIDPRNPIFGDVHISAADLTGLAKEMGHEVILAHVATCEGATILSQKEQKELARHDVLVELNGRLSASLNAIAIEYAQRYNLVLVAGGDSHISAHDQYTSTANSVHGNGDTSTPLSMLAKLRKEKKNHSMRVSRPGIRETLATGKHILKKGGSKLLQSLLRCKRRQLFGY